jgi:hypothetical protein
MGNAAYSLEHLTDTQLLDSLADKTRQATRLTAELLAHLAEVDARRIYLPLGFPSLFQFCLSRLAFSEDEAAKRIQAARAARRHPVIFELVATAKLTLTAVTLLAPHLDERNAESLLAMAEGKSKRALEELLAARFAKPDAPMSLRKLPMGNGTAGGVPDSPLPLPALASAAATTALATAGGRQVDVSRQVDALPVAPLTRTARTVVEPLSAERFKLQVTLSRQGRDALLRAQGLLRHQVPSGDLSTVLERALTLLCEELEGRKFGKRKATGRRPVSRDPGAGARVAMEYAPEQVPAAPEAGSARADAAPPLGVTRPDESKAGGRHVSRSRYIPRPVRRAVAERDGFRCAYVSSDGRRCEATSGLEYHHRLAYARGGQATVEQIELRCRGHNDLQARLDFGEAHMAAAKQRQLRKTPST